MWVHGKCRNKTSLRTAKIKCLIFPVYEFTYLVFEEEVTRNFTYLYFTFGV